MDCQSKRQLTRNPPSALTLTTMFRYASPSNEAVTWLFVMLVRAVSERISCSILVIMAAYTRFMFGEIPGVCFGGLARS